VVLGWVAWWVVLGGFFLLVCLFVLLLGSLVLFTWWCGTSEGFRLKVGASSLVLNAFAVGILTFCLQRKRIFSMPNVLVKHDTIGKKL